MSWLAGSPRVSLPGPALDAVASSLGPECQPGRDLPSPLASLDQRYEDIDFLVALAQEVVGSMTANEGFLTHPSAIVESDDIGAGTRIWAFAHVMDGARIGDRCNIGEGCFIERGAVLGNDVTVKNGVAVWDGVTVENAVFLGPNVTLTNDKRPRSVNLSFELGKTTLEEGCTIGANATLLSGIVVGRFAFVGAGTVLTRDVPPHGLVFGNPGNLVGHVCVCASTLEFTDEVAHCECGREFKKRGTEGSVVESS